VYVSPRYPNTRKQCMKTLALRARVFIHCFLVFGYLGETLALVVHILRQNGKIHHFCNKICCQTSMFINSRTATFGKYCDVPVYSGKMSWYSVIFRHIPWYSGIPGFHNALFSTLITMNTMLYYLQVEKKDKVKRIRPLTLTLIKH
jgi:hypothetical protein